MEPTFVVIFVVEMTSAFVSNCDGLAKRDQLFVLLGILLFCDDVVKMMFDAASGQTDGIVLGNIACKDAGNALQLFK